LRKLIHAIGYHGYTLWLFTVSDHKPLVYPMTITGLLNLFAGITLNASPVQSWSSLEILSRLPAVIFWVWINFLVFCLGNQRRPSSIAEDALNKPWRPIPSQRITPSNATALWIVLHAGVLLACAYFGATIYTVALLALGYMYNDLEGGEHPFTRNLINACAVVWFALGATTVAYAGQPLLLNQQAMTWQCIIGAIVLTTLQVQDLHDQEGDRDRGRSTLPLVYGDVVTRWSVVVPMLAWSLAVPVFWALPWWGFVGPCSIGFTICARLMALRTVSSDRKSYKMWGLWISCLLASPAVAACV
jgi:4-hydroxybenzoate polyprenyltransferase